MIRFPFDFGDGDGAVLKRFVVLGHVQEHNACICAKTTSRLGRFHGDPALQRGCVHYPEGSVACFERETVIEPANSFALEYWKLRRYASRAELEILQVLDENVRSELQRAVTECRSLTPSRKANLLAVIQGRFRAGA